MGIRNTTMANSEADCNPIHGNLDNLDIEKKIGKGQFSEVYRAKNKINNEHVALKKIQVSYRLISM